MENPIAFYPQLARELGDISSAIYYQQLYYWSDKGKRDDGYIYKTKENIEQETTIKIKAQDRIRKELEAKGWIKTKLIMANGSPTLHYKCLVDIEVTFSNRSKRPKPIGGNDRFESVETTDSITENTTENTTYIENLVYEPLKGNKTKKAFTNRARAKLGKPPLLNSNPEVWRIINLYRAQYKYITGKTVIVSDADYFHVLAITKKLSPQEMDAMIIWYVKLENPKFKAHPNLKSIFTPENINKFNLEK